MELLNTCYDLFKRSQLAVFDRALGMADVFDRAVSDSVDAIQGAYTPEVTIERTWYNENEEQFSEKMAIFPDTLNPRSAFIIFIPLVALGSVALVYKICKKSLQKKVDGIFYELDHRNMCTPKMSRMVQTLTEPNRRTSRPDYTNMKGAPQPGSTQMVPGPNTSSYPDNDFLDRKTSPKTHPYPKGRLELNYSNSGDTNISSVLCVQKMHRDVSWGTRRHRRHRRKSQGSFGNKPKPRRMRRRPSYRDEELSHISSGKQSRHGSARAFPVTKKMSYSKQQISTVKNFGVSAQLSPNKQRRSRSKPQESPFSTRWGGVHVEKSQHSPKTLMKSRTISTEKIIPPQGRVINQEIRKSGIKNVKNEVGTHTKHFDFKTNYKRHENPNVLNQLPACAATKLLIKKHRKSSPQKDRQKKIRPQIVQFVPVAPNKRCKTCKKACKVSPSSSRYSHVLVPKTANKNPGSLFSFVPKRHPLEPPDIYKKNTSSKDVLTQKTNGAPSFHSFTERGAFQKYIHRIEDTNMNKSGIKFGVKSVLSKCEESDNSRCALESNLNVSKTTEWPETKIYEATSEWELPDCQLMHTDTFQNGSVDGQLQTNCAQTLREYKERSHQSSYRISSVENSECCLVCGKEDCHCILRADDQSVVSDISTSYTPYDHYTAKNSGHNHKCLRSEGTTHLSTSGRHNILAKNRRYTNRVSEAVPSYWHHPSSTRKLLFKRKNIRNEYLKKYRKFKKGKRGSKVCFEIQNTQERPLLKAMNATKEFIQSVSYLNSNKSGGMLDESSHAETSLIQASYFEKTNMKDISNTIPKESTWLKELNKHPLIQQDITDGLATNRCDEELMGHFELNPNTEGSAKRCDKIRSHKWRYRHEPYKSVVMKNSRRLPSSGSKSTSFTLGKREPFVVEEKLFCLPKHYRPTTTRYTPESDSVDPISISKGSPKNKNNCSPSRGAKQHLNSMVGSLKPPKDQISQQNDLEKRDCFNINSSKEGIRKTEKTYTSIFQCCEEQKKQPENQGFSFMTRYPNDFQEPVRKAIDGPQTMQSASETLGKTMEFSQNETYTKNSWPDFSLQLNSDSLCAGKVQSLPSEHSSTSINTSHLQRQRIYLKQKRMKYPQKKQTLKSVCSWNKPNYLSPKRQHCNFVSLGIQTSNTSLVNIAVQTSPYLDCTTLRRPKDKLFKLRDIHNFAHGKPLAARGNFTFHGDTQALIEGSALNPLPKSSLDCLNTVNSTGVMHPDSKEPCIASDEKAPSRMKKDVAQILENAPSDTLSVENIFGNTERTGNTTSAENITFGFSANNEFKDDLINPFDSVAPIVREPSFPSVSLPSNVDVKNDVMSSSASSSTNVSLGGKSWMTRPRWEDANVEEINRRVEKALRLRQELQRYKNCSAINSPQNAVSMFLKSDQLANAAQDETTIKNITCTTNESDSIVSQTNQNHTAQNDWTRLISNTTGSLPRKWTTVDAKKEDNTDLFRKGSGHLSRNVPTSEGISENLIASETTDTQETTAFRARQTESLMIDHTSPTQVNCTNVSLKKMDNFFVPTANAASEPDLSYSYNEDINDTPVTSVLIRPSSATTLSRFTFASCEENGLLFARETQPKKNSPPIKLSKMENVIQSHPKLVDELVQALPQVPLSSFVEWFIETSHPDQYNNSEQSCSPDARNENKTNIKESTSVSGENFDTLMKVKHTEASSDSFVTDGDVDKSTIRVSSDTPDPSYRKTMLSEMNNPSGEDRTFTFGEVVSGRTETEDGTERRTSSIRRILLTKGDDSTDGRVGASVTTGKRRFITIRQSSDSSTFIDKNSSQDHGC